MAGSVDGARESEHARVGRALGEPPFQQPGEEGALPPAACLRHAINGFLNAAHARSTICAKGGVAWRCVTVDNFSVLELALQISRDEIPATHVKTASCSERGE
eukprot:1909422-Pleurochrysis_carterae.AAC.1